MPKQAEYIDGSQSTQSYIVLHKTPTHILGVRPLMVIGRSDCFIGARIRLVWNSENSGTSEVPNLHSNPGAAYSQFNWGKESEQRCSMIVGQTINRGAANYQEVREFLAENSIPRLLLNLIESQLGHDIENMAEASEYFWDEYGKVLESAEETYKILNAPVFDLHISMDGQSSIDKIYNQNIAAAMESISKKKPLELAHDTPAEETSGEQEGTEQHELPAPE